MMTIAAILAAIVSIAALFHSIFGFRIPQHVLRVPGMELVEMRHEQTRGAKPTSVLITIYKPQEDFGRDHENLGQGKSVDGRKAKSKKIERPSGKSPGQGKSVDGRKAKSKKIERPSGKSPGQGKSPSQPTRKQKK